jgi:hypothetical protein
MDASEETSLEPRKEWVTPELKKIDIDAITGLGPEISNDFYNGGGPVS